MPNFNQLKQQAVQVGLDTDNQEIRDLCEIIMALCTECASLADEQGDTAEMDVRGMAKAKHAKREAR